MMPGRAAYLALSACLLMAASDAVLAADVKAPRPASDIYSAYPAKALLRGPDSVQQIAIDLKQPDGTPADATTRATFRSKNEAIASVDSFGTITAVADGKTEVVVSVAGKDLVIPVEVKDVAHPPAVNFANEVVPVFTKLGCNAGGCHGKASGQNGFRLSLLGFEPWVDYETLVKEGRGRRLFPAAPDQSLLLTKAIAKVPHGGGKRMEPGSHEFRVIERWIGGGMPMGKSDDPTVAKIEVYPDARVLPRGVKQQLVVTATYTDGRKEDVTRWAHYQSNDTEVAAVADGGQVETRGLSGQAAIMARYQGQVVVFRATVPLGKPISAYPEFASNNVVDRNSLKQWKALGIIPSEDCTDAEFIRRASLDIIGTLPTAAETKAFVEEKSASKRAALVDRLLERPEYASYFAIRWADILKNKRDGNGNLQRLSFRFHDWIRENLAKNTPYDQFVRGVLAASGSPDEAPPVMWYKRLKTPDAFVDDTAQVFLGMRLQCAKCHHHPFERWAQDDYYGFAAFFGKVGRKPNTNGKRRGNADEETIFLARGGSVQHPKTGKTMEPKGLGDKVVQVSGRTDPREKLVEWMADPANPYFARAVVNRYWAHFFGRGIVEPMDDQRLTNPPSNPDLLDGLSDSFVKSGFDLKQLVRTICTSKTYGLSSIPNEYNAKDKQSFARHYPKRMGAEVLLDAISQVTAVPTAFGGLPTGTRAIDLPDESIASSFLDTFGRPKRDTACECERVSDASLGQSLMLLNSSDVQTKLTTAGGRAEALVKDTRPEPVKIEELFWDAFGRGPSSSELATAVHHVESRKDKKREAYEDILWALVNAKEFQFND